MKLCQTTVWILSRTLLGTVVFLVRSYEIWITEKSLMYIAEGRTLYSTGILKSMDWLNYEVFSTFVPQ